jgi:rubrerythrin
MFGWLDELEGDDEPLARAPNIPVSKTSSSASNEVLKRAKEHLSTLKRERDEMENNLEKLTHSYTKLEGDYKNICDINEAGLAKNKEYATRNAELERSVELLSDDAMFLSAGKKARVNPYMCRICLKHVITMVVYPCRHAVMCKGCVEELNKQGKSCPICRTKILHTGNVFICP